MSRSHTSTIFAPFTWAAGWAIVVSASFLRQVHDFIFFHKSLGPNFVKFLVIAGLTLPGIFAFVYLWKRRAGLRSLLLSIVVFAGLAWISIASGIFATVGERVHLINFGLLGWLMCRDAYPRFRAEAVFIALAGCAFFAAAEEIFQFYLPYRTGELRDVELGLIGGSFGIAARMAAAWGTASNIRVQGSSNKLENY